MLDAPYGVLTAPRARRLPQSTMVTFLADDDPMKLSLNTSRRKARNLMARPRAALLVPNSASPYRTLEIRGDVETTPDTTIASPGTSAASTAEPTSGSGQAGRVAGGGRPAPGPHQCHRSQAAAGLLAADRLVPGPPLLRPRPRRGRSTQATKNGARLISRATRPGEAVNIVACAARLIAAPGCLVSRHDLQVSTTSHLPSRQPIADSGHEVSGAGGCLDPLVGWEAPTGARPAPCGSPR